MSLDDQNDPDLSREFFRGSFPGWFVDFYLCRSIYLASFESRKRHVVRLSLWLLDITIAALLWAIIETLVPFQLHGALFQSMLIGGISGYLLARYWCSRL
jgi:hypothetical protein